VALLESDRAYLRHALGFGSIFLQQDPILENALTAIQSIADGGTRVDSSTETLVKGWATDLQTVEGMLKNLWPQAQMAKADESGIDAFRGRAMLCAEGRRIVGYICRACGLTGPRSDVFSSPAALSAQGNPFGGG
jgi:hypothetical protein